MIVAEREHGQRQDVRKVRRKKLSGKEARKLRVNKGRTGY